MKETEFAIRVQNLSKCYQIYDRPVDRLKQFVVPYLQRIVRQPPKQYFRGFWAVKDVSFEVKKGETVGIIGRNGSGKSTLLQIISGTLTPTQGSVETNGRVAALLELGSGFNSEFTGRENVYMNASVLGLTNKEIDARFDDIVAFADIGDFIEQPLKTYSSGMMLRLAFAVSVYVDPEILIVDEALSVGDELFQRKCFSRLEQIREKGTTILFVSHSASSIIQFCNRVILMDGGETLAIGLPNQIVRIYQKMLYAPVDKLETIRQQVKTLDASILNRASVVEDLVLEQCQPDLDQQEQIESFDSNLKPSSTIYYESHGAIINDVEVLNMDGCPVNNLVRGNTYFYTYTVKFTQNVNNVRFSMSIKTISGVPLGGGVSANSFNQGLSHVETGSIYRVKFLFSCSLNAGIYFMNAAVLGSVSGTETYLDRVMDIVVFRVLSDVDSLTTGDVDFGCFPEIELLKE